MTKKNLTNDDIDIQVAERKNLKENNFKFKKYFIFKVFFLIFLSAFIGLAFKSNLKLNFFRFNNAKGNVNDDLSILGHLPY